MFLGLVFLGLVNFNLDESAKNALPKKEFLKFPPRGGVNFETGTSDLLNKDFILRWWGF
jgi:hypothetical protein